MLVLTAVSAILPATSGAFSTALELAGCGRARTATTTFGIASPG